VREYCVYGMSGWHGLSGLKYRLLIRSVSLPVVLTAQNASQSFARPSSLRTSVFSNRQIAKLRLKVVLNYCEEAYSIEPSLRDGTPHATHTCRDFGDRAFQIGLELFESLGRGHGQQQMTIQAPAEPLRNDDLRLPRGQQCLDCESRDSSRERETRIEKSGF
jgi:hypothetical protein